MGADGCRDIRHRRLVLIPPGEGKGRCCWARAGGLGLPGRPGLWEEGGRQEHAVFARSLAWQCP